MPYSELAVAEAPEELKVSEGLLPSEPVIYALRASPATDLKQLQGDDFASYLRVGACAWGCRASARFGYGLREHQGTPLLAAAQQGLKLEPRDVDLLRLQMLAYQGIAPESSEYKAAAKVFLAHKRDEKASAIRIACSQTSAECLKEQLPIPERTLKLNNPTNSQD